MNRRTVAGVVVVLLALLIVGTGGYQYTESANALNLATLIAGALLLVAGGYLIATPGA